MPGVTTAEFQEYGRCGNLIFISAEIDVARYVGINRCVRTQFHNRKR